MSGGESGGLSKLAATLVIIFVITLMVLLAQLFYVLWRRRVFRSQTDTVGRGDEVSHYSSPESNFSSAAYSSKELLYFSRIRPQFRVEHNASATGNDLNPNQRPDMEVIDIDLLKINGKFGPPRFLLTVRGEGRGDLESPAVESLCAAEKEMKREADDEDESRVGSEDSAAAMDDRSGDAATPFSTPCASPLYFTPSGSPVHEAINGCST